MGGIAMKKSATVIATLFALSVFTGRLSHGQSGDSLLYWLEVQRLQREVRRLQQQPRSIIVVAPTPSALEKVQAELAQRAQRRAEAEQEKKRKDDERRARREAAQAERQAAMDNAARQFAERQALEQQKQAILGAGTEQETVISVAQTPANEPELPMSVKIAATIPPWPEIEQSPQFPTFSVEQKCLVVDQYEAEALEYVATLPGANLELEKQSLDQWASKMKERYRTPSK
jgi:hypothetical protein